MYCLTEPEVCELATLLLNDDWGINTASHQQLCLFALNNQWENLQRLMATTKATNNRWFLPIQELP